MKILIKFFRIKAKITSFIYKKWNKIWFHLIGVKYGKKMNVYNKVYINGWGKIIIGDNFKFTSGDGVNPICRNIKGEFYTMTPEAQIIIGDNVGISSACIWAKESITIGNDVKIGGDCIIMDTDVHPHDYLDRRDVFLVEHGRREYLKTIPSAPVVICDDVWIGARCQILKGVHMGPRTIIAAGSIVTKSMPADCICGGNPCRIIKQL